MPIVWNYTFQETIHLRQLIVSAADSCYLKILINSKATIGGWRYNSDTILLVTEYSESCRRVARDTKAERQRQRRKEAWKEAQEGERRNTGVPRHVLAFVCIYTDKSETNGRYLVTKRPREMEEYVYRGEGSSQGVSREVKGGEARVRYAMCEITITHP